MTFRTERDLDDLDWRILDELQSDGRLSYKELGRRVNLSSPAVAERVRRLEDSGVITGYVAQVDPGRAGYPISAFVEMRCTLGDVSTEDRHRRGIPRGRGDPQAERGPLLDAPRPVGFAGAFRGVAGKVGETWGDAVQCRTVDAV